VRRLMQRQRRTLASHDAGFTLIEILVAMSIIVIVMTALLGVLVSSLKTVAQARQRQTATALSTQSMERFRALAYDSVTGSDPTNFPLPTSPALQYVTGSAPNSYTFTPTGVLSGVSEPLVVNQYSGKRSSQPVDGVTYTVLTYVTKPGPTAAGQQAYNLTVITTWVYPAGSTTRTTVERSTAYSPPGCLSTAQRPFSGPCQAYFTAQSGLSGAGFSVRGTDSTAPIEGLSGRIVELTLPDLSSNLEIEQTASGSALGGTSGGHAAAATDTTVGGVSAAVSVDSDPSSAAAQSNSATAIQSSGAASLTGVGTLAALPTSGDSATGAAAIAADSTVCKDGDSSGSALSTGPAGQLRPCASAKSQPGGSGGSITFKVGADTVPVATLAAASSASRAVSALLATTNSAACSAGAAVPGCAHSEAYRVLGTVVVGSETGGTGPLDSVKGLFTVTGLTESVIAERGVGAGTSGYTRVGTLSLWNGTAYTPVDLSGYAAPPTAAQTPSQSWTVPSVTTTYGALSVTMTATITVQRPTITTSGPANCVATACVTQVSGAGGITAQTTFTVLSGGVEISKFVLSTDLGGLVGQSTYKAAPSA